MIVYLLGAGASCKKLPLVKDIPRWLSRWIESLKNLSIAGKVVEEKTQYLRQLGDDIGRLYSQTRSHSSVDTFAKKLHFRIAREELLRLKITLSCCFFLEQATSDVDPRYDAFLAAILEQPEWGKVHIPDSISILTWNVTTQVDF